MKAEVIQGDCLEVMRGIPDGSIDACVTDPPYGIGFNYDGGREQTNTPESYWRWLEPRFKEISRVVRPGGLIAIWQAQLNFPYFWQWFGFDIHIYCAAKNFVQLRKAAINYGYDPVVMRYKSGAEPLCPKRGESGAYRNVDFYVADTASVVSQPLSRVPHPCPRPLDQMCEVIRNFTLPGGLVLDPFCGSGTTGAACMIEGRDFIGVEEDAGYCELARARISRAQGVACDIPKRIRAEKELPLFAVA